jgi:hypothetical protein
MTMGAEPWSYFVPYHEDIQVALSDLQRQEFEAGRYRIRDTDHPPATMTEARAQFPESGTGTVLDMLGVVDEPHEVDAEVPNFFMVAPLSPQQLVTLYGTEKPTHEMVKARREFYEWIDRGLGVYIVVYEGDTPSELFFAGYSLD